MLFLFCNLLYINDISLERNLLIKGQATEDKDLSGDGFLCAIEVA